MINLRASSISGVANGVTFAVVGGTRKYTKAHGTATATQVGFNKPVELAFRGS